jgi:hypothetical protein
MQCHWCKGTYEECGCGEGHCAHCDNGEVTNPPYGPKRYLEGDDIIIYDFDGLIDYNHPSWFNNACEKVSIKIAGKMVLNEKDIQIFSDYWNDQKYRDETIGDVLQRVAMFINDKIK